RCSAYDAFFFASRRRHTRSKRDWSSDVCSSDLTLLCKTAFLQCAAADAAHRRPFHGSWLSGAAYQQGAQDIPYKDGDRHRMAQEIGRASCREGAWKGVGEWAGTREKTENYSQHG